MARDPDKRGPDKRGLTVVVVHFLEYRVIQANRPILLYGSKENDLDNTSACRMMHAVYFDTRVTHTYGFTSFHVTLICSLLHFECGLQRIIIMGIII